MNYSKNSSTEDREQEGRENKGPADEFTTGHKLN
jgi:hypothetical protein